MRLANAFFLPQSVRHPPESVCGMLRFGCAAYSEFTVRLAPNFAFYSESTITKLSDIHSPAIDDSF